MDILKGYALLAMILLHVSAVGLSEAEVGCDAWHVSNFYNNLCRFCVPIFIMISGAIFLSRDISMRKYIKRLSLALLFWCSVYAIYISIPEILSGKMTIGLYVNRVVSPTHLWFLWMILPLYLATPIFRAIVKDRNATEWFLWLWLAFGIIIPAMQFLPSFGQYVKTIVDQTHFFLVLEYGGYYVLGYFLVTNTIKSLEKYAMYYVIIGIIVSVIGTYLVSSPIKQTSELFLGYMFPTTFLTSVGLFVYFKNHAGQWKMPPIMLKLISILSISSLGIYAVHMFFLVAFHKIGLTYSILNSIVSIPLICLLCVTISITVAYVIRRFVPYGKTIT